MVQMVQMPNWGVGGSGGGGSYQSTGGAGTPNQGYPGGSTDPGYVASGGGDVRSVVLEKLVATVVTD